jgi:hypothetical protein
LIAEDIGVEELILRIVTITGAGCGADGSAWTGSGWQALVQKSAQACINLRRFDISFVRR